LETDEILRYADLLDLDVRRMADDLRSGVHLAKIRRDFRAGKVRSGVDGTPTFIINGRRFDGSWDRDGLVHAIREAASAGARPHA
jgi:predicted DsbA family dithiol-disulfide isomerase